MNERIRLLAEQAEEWNSEGDKCEVNLEKFADLVDAAARADEREACAKFVDHILKEGGGTYGDAIRAGKHMTGFKSKRAAAQNKLNDDDDAQGYIAEYESALQKEYQRGYDAGKKAALAGREWNFCERCGKRTQDIHTCTPPQENT